MQVANARAEESASQTLQLPDRPVLVRFSGDTADVPPAPAC